MILSPEIILTFVGPHFVNASAKLFIVDIKLVSLISCLS